jgi:sec-independent protein translocase protein TatC
MSFLDHLEDLRWLLVRSTLAIVIMAFATYFFSDYLFDTIIFGPVRQHLQPINFFVTYPNP